MSQQNLIIIAAGGLGSEAAWVARSAPRPWTVQGFLDDAPALFGQTVVEAPVLGPIASWTEYPEASFVIAIGSPRIRREVATRMRGIASDRWATILHCSVQMSPYVAIGRGSIVLPNVSITTNVSMGSHCVINPGCTIAHDCSIGDFCTLAPLVGLSGNVSLGSGVEIGTGACIRQGLTIDRGSMIGMGSVLTKDVAENAVWMGNPAAQRRSTDPWRGSQW